MLQQIVFRIRQAKCLSELVIATSVEPQDDKIEDLARELKVACFRGSELDCLDRFYQAALSFQADVVVRLSCDNPLVNGDFIDMVVTSFLQADPPYDFVDSTRSRTYPSGLAVEVFTFAALEAAWKGGFSPLDREHITYFIYSHPEQFRCLHLMSLVDFGYMDWSVDTLQGLTFVRTVYDYFGSRPFSWKDVALAVSEHPNWTY